MPSCSGPLVATMCPSNRSSGPAVHVGDHPAGLLDDQRAGGDVPRVQMLFPEPVEAAGRDVAEIERRRSRAGEPRALRRGTRQRRRPGAGALRARCTETRCTTALSTSAGASGDANRLAVQPRAVATLGREQLLGHRVVDHADLEGPSIRARSTRRTAPARARSSWCRRPDR